MNSATCIYFCRAGECGPIKIGMSEDPTKRLHSLQTAQIMPLVLMGSIPGGRKEERHWHQRFAHLRIRGEWFHGVPELMEAIMEAMEDPWASHE